MSSRLERLVGRLPPKLRTPARLAVETGRDAADDRIAGLAAEIAFWALLSLPPLLLATVAAAGFVGDQIGEDVRTAFINRIGELASEIFTEVTVEATITPTLDALLTSGSPPLLSLSFLVTIYSASRALRVIVHALNLAYDLEDAQPSWRSRIQGLVFTLAGLVIGLVLIPLVVAGPRLGAIIESRIGMDLLLGDIWRVLYWPVALVVVTALLALLYHFATPWRTPFHRELPGAAVATLLGLLASVGLRTYTTAAFGSDAVYAPLAAPLALLVWIYAEALALLLGAELNAEIERAFPAGEPPPDRLPLSRLGRRAVDEVRDLAGRVERRVGSTRRE